jgi:hypothetical protein
VGERGRARGDTILIHRVLRIHSVFCILLFISDLAGMGDVPQNDVVYNVVIGETVTGGGDDHYHVLQCMYIPL